MSEIEGMLERYAAAARARDVDALVGLYAGDVVLFDAWESWSTRGIEAWRSAVETWFANAGDDTIAVTFDELEEHVAGDGAVAHMVVRYAAEGADGQELRALENRMTWALERRNGAWRIVHEHSSAPAEFATGKIQYGRPAAA
jgi:uncharacterized protein (TIGR02246 family)